ncbi:MAG: hypothetical protein JJ902_08700 [Roseibium sp.]|nr:hypothetical protein [Roseibium sp.]
MRPLAKNRFDELTFGLRAAGSREAWRDVSFWSNADETLLGVLSYAEHADGYMGMILARDDHRRYRPLGNAVIFRTKGAGDHSICARIAELDGEGTSKAETPNGEEPGVDLFTIDHDRTLNPIFENLRGTLHSTAARTVLQEIAHWFIDRDGNFVRDFQTTGISARLFELYLFRAFHALDFSVDQSIAVPDFVLKRGDITLYVEATTANPVDTMDIDLLAGPTPPPEDFWRFIENDMPVIFGSPLYSKLKKKYWEKEPVKGHPFAIAIADFHAPASMIWSHTALSIYLFGISVERSVGPHGEEIALPRPLKIHRRGEKVIQAGFFDLPDTRHISAILFSNAATKAKFTRMGTLAGFGHPECSVHRKGGLSNPEPGALSAIPFECNIEDGAYEEDWADELEIYHNPNALIPWPGETVIPQATHFRRQTDDELVWRGAPFRVLFSSTKVEHKPSPPFDDDTDSSAGETSD